MACNALAFSCLMDFIKLILDSWKPSFQIGETEGLKIAGTGFETKDLSRLSVYVLFKLTRLANLFALQSFQALRSLLIWPIFGVSNVSDPSQGVYFIGWGLIKSYNGRQRFKLALSFLSSVLTGVSVFS